MIKKEGKNVKGCLVCWGRVGSSPGVVGCHLSLQSVCGAGTVCPSLRVWPHAFPRAEPHIKGHAIGNVEHTWEARKPSLSKRVSWRFSALSDLAPQHPHSTTEK